MKPGSKEKGNDDFIGGRGKETLGEPGGG